MPKKAIAKLIHSERQTLQSLNSLGKTSETAYYPIQTIRTC